MRIAVTGASGLIGTALIASLVRDGHSVVPITRHRSSKTPDSAVVWDPVEGRLNPTPLEGLDAVVHLAGAGIGDHRWTNRYKHTISESRTISTSLLATSLAGLKRRPSVFVSGSAIGYYGERGDEVLTEQSARGTGFLADVCDAWEKATWSAETAGIRTVHIRTSAVVSPTGGMLAKLMPMFRVGLGGPMGKGDQWWSWISITDEIRAIRYAIDSDLSGPVNLSAPEPVTAEQFATTLGKVLGRPSKLTTPAFAPRFAKGRELADALLFTSQRVKPAVLLDHGFSFTNPSLKGALREVLGCE